MTPLREKMIKAMELRNLAHNTQRYYMRNGGQPLNQDNFVLVQVLSPLPSHINDLLNHRVTVN